MGPRSADRGIFAKNHCIPHDILLQWGRDQLIAELACLWTCFQKRSRLQWGRDQLIAELILFTVVAVATLKALQWGRDQLIAEFYRSMRFSRRLGMASMGPRSADRGIRRGG